MKRGRSLFDEEAARLVQVIQPLEVEIPPIHHVVSPGLRQQQVEHVDFVHLAVGDMNKAGNIPAQIEQRVQLDGGLRRPERCPRKNRQAQIDRRRVERVNRFRQIHPEGFLGIQAARDTDQALGEARVDTPIAGRIGVGERVARDIAANPQVIELRRLRSKARLDISQALSVGQLREGHAQVLVQTREGIALWVGRRAPCPTDLLLARSCQRLRRISFVLYSVAFISFLLGATFAFLLPALGQCPVTMRRTFMGRLLLPWLVWSFTLGAPPGEVAEPSAVLFLIPPPDVQDQGWAGKLLS